MQMNTGYLWKIFWTYMFLWCKYCSSLNINYVIDYISEPCGPLAYCCFNAPTPHNYIYLLTLFAPNYPKLHIAAVPSNFSIIASFSRASTKFDYGPKRANISSRLYNNFSGLLHLTKSVWECCWKFRLLLNLPNLV